MLIEREGVNWASKSTNITERSPPLSGCVGEPIIGPWRHGLLGFWMILDVWMSGLLLLDFYYLDDEENTYWCLVGNEGMIHNHYQ